MGFENVIDKAKMQVFKNPFYDPNNVGGGICQTYVCRSPARWLLSKFDGPKHMSVNMCDKCLKDLIESIVATDELREIAIEFLEKKAEEIDLKNEPSVLLTKCPHCGFEAKSHAGLMAHIRGKHK